MHDIIHKRSFNNTLPYRDSMELKQNTKLGKKYITEQFNNQSEDQHKYLVTKVSKLCFIRQEED